MALPTRLRFEWELAWARGTRIARAGGLRSPTTRYVWQRAPEHRRCWQSAAAGLGAEFVELTDRVWEVRRGGHTIRLANDLVQLDDPVVLEIAGDKELTYRLVAQAGVAVPTYVVVDRSDAARTIARFDLDDAPLVVKPARGTSAGMGVTVGVRGVDELLRAVAVAMAYAPRVIVQRMVAGESCRLLFLGGRLIHAVRRRGLRVIPDGRSSIAGLLAAQGDSSALRSRMVLDFLAAAGRTPETILPEGAVAIVSGVPAGEARRTSLRTVYDEDITHIVGAQLAEDAGRAVAAIGSSWAGVDIVTPDPTRGLRDCGALIEVNTTPGILHHCRGDGTRCHTAQLVLEHLLGAA